MIDKLKLAHIDYADKIRYKDKMHREQRKFELLMIWLQWTWIVDVTWEIDGLYSGFCMMIYTSGPGDGSCCHHSTQCSRVWRSDSLHE